VNTRFSESVVEDAALVWLEALGYAVLHGPDIAAGEPGAERSGPNYRDVLLEWRLRQALVGVEDGANGTHRIVVRQTMEIEGQTKPALIADTIRMTFS
jgi:hypothetical protein